MAAQARTATSADPEKVGRGLKVGPITEDDFRNFVKRFADSPEIGPIATCLDRDARPNPDAEQYAVGLWGCEKLCAVACIELYRSKVDGSSQVLKLDSVIVDPELRRRGLGGLLVAQTFLDLVANEDLNVIRIYAHSVHPATVLMLSRLAFKDPPVTGAPISQVCLEQDNRDAFLRACDGQVRTQLAQKALQCEFCRVKSRRARPWCLPRGK